MTEVMGLPVAWECRFVSGRGSWGACSASDAAIFAKDRALEVRPLYTAAQARALADAEVARYRELATEAFNEAARRYTHEEAQKCMAFLGTAALGPGIPTEADIEWAKTGIHPDTIRARGPGDGNERS